MREWFRSGIFRKMLLSILAVSLVPLTVLGILTLLSTEEAGDMAIDRSREALDDKSAEALELRGVEIANAVADFLREREADLRTLSYLPRTPEAYTAFYDDHAGELWLPGEDAHRVVPLYREIAYIDAGGQEVLKIADGQVAGPGELRDVSDPANTTYKSETYFTDAVKLPPGEIHVSHVAGFFVSRTEFQAGKRFEGVLRFAMPVFARDGSLEGVVELALDSRHIEEFTAHVVPTEERFAAAPDPAAGNYAYIIDDRSACIAHPDDSLQWGVGRDGETLPYASKAEEIGVLPVLLEHLGFIDEKLAGIPAIAARGEAGSMQYYWGGHDKFVGYAPIPYYGGGYSPPGGFGWVAIGAEVDTFHRAATTVGEAIQERVKVLVTGSIAILVVTGLAVLFTSGVLARHISGPIQQLIDAAQTIEQGGDDAEDDLKHQIARVTEAAADLEANRFQPETLDCVATRSDELGQLARVFQRMAREVYAREERLRRQVHELRVEIDEKRRAHEVAQITESEYFQNLRKKVRDIKKKKGEQPPDSQD